MNAYAKNREWSDQFIEHIRQIVGPKLLVAAPLELDTQQATDLLVFRARDMRIAARVRRPEYQERFKYEFTIRSEVRCGAKTEIDKVTQGWGDWMLYGFAAPTHQKVEWWSILDLDRFRDYWRRTGWRLSSFSGCNGDGTRFLAFDLRTMPDVILYTNHIHLPTPSPCLALR
jgi:hypothetical protein